MLEIKAYFGDWKEATKEQAENFYKTFCDGSLAIKCEDRYVYFNEHHIRGGHILRNGKAETTEELEERMFASYKKELKTLGSRIRFNCIEYLCGFPGIDPFVMAASLINDGNVVLYDDSSISEKENRAKERKVKKLLTRKE